MTSVVLPNFGREDADHEAAGLAGKHPQADGAQAVVGPRPVVAYAGGEVVVEGRARDRVRGRPVGSFPLQGGPPRVPLPSGAESTRVDGVA